MMEWCLHGFAMMHQSIHIPKYLLVLALAVACGSPQTSTRNDPPSADTGPTDALTDLQGQDTRGSANQSPAAQGRPPVATAATLESLGEGFITWESNRSGNWRLWTQTLAAKSPVQLSPDEKAKVHCCGHISPDGSQVAYLSLSAPKHKYPDGDTSGELRLIHPDGTNQRVIGPARIYGENRAAVWRNDHQLIYIDDRGRTQQLNLDTGEKKQLLEHAAEAHGWLVNATLTAATAGSPTFSNLQGNVIQRSEELPGCQPYFSHDGAWGFWTGGAGGPIYGLRLDGRSRKPILLKDDPRLPKEWRYLYFPMISRDGAFLTWGASRGRHDHYKADYEVFVAEIDPTSLDVIGDPIRVTNNPATDRYADIFVATRELGTFRGEAPLIVDWKAPESGAWSWSSSDGIMAADTSAWQHTYEEPGTYTVTAKLGQREPLQGRVVVRPAAPPALLATSILGNQQVRLEFDEPVSTDSFGIEGGAAVESIEGRTVVVSLSSPLDGFLELRLAGVRDLLGNESGPIVVGLDPTLWPVEYESTVAMWSGVDGFNVFRDPGVGNDEALVVTRKGLAVPAASGGVHLDGGWLEVDTEQSHRLTEILQGTHEFTFELLVNLPQDASGELVTWGLPVPGNADLGLTLANGTLTSYLRGTPKSRPGISPQQSGRLGEGLHHLAAVFTLGELTIYLDGNELSSHDNFADDLFHWQTRVLRIGGRDNAPNADLAGELNGFAIHRRALTAETVADVARRALHGIATPVSQWDVVGERIGSTAVPTLDEISPYREALVTRHYRLENPPTGLSSEVVVVEWGILDGVTLPDPQRNRQLELERFSDQAALQGLFLANDFKGEELYYTSPSLPSR